jgi:hypothetical protein
MSGYRGKNIIRTLVDELHGIGQCPSKGHTAATTNWIMENICAELDKTDSLK